MLSAGSKIDYLILNTQELNEPNLVKIIQMNFIPEKLHQLNQ